LASAGQCACVMALERHHAARSIGRLRLAGVTCQHAQVTLVRGAGARHALVAADQVVVAVGQAQATLPGDRTVDARLPVVRHHPQHHRRVHPALLAAHPHGQRPPRSDRVDRRQQRGHRCQAGAVDGGGVDVAGEELADLARRAARPGRLHRQPFDQGAHAPVRQVGQLDEAAPRRLVGRDLGGLQPGAVDGTEQVILRPHDRGRSSGRRGATRTTAESAATAQQRGRAGGSGKVSHRRPRCRVEIDRSSRLARVGVRPAPAWPDAGSPIAPTRRLPARAGTACVGAVRPSGG
jgi:hypothetical protein